MRHRTAARLLLAAMICFFTTTTLAGDDDTVKIVKVEETWELAVGEPSLVANAPQVSMVMSPLPDLNHDYFLFLLNYRTMPDYTAGGYQVHHWTGDQVNGYQNGSHEVPLSTTSETVTWTQVLTVDSGTVTFDIQNGLSSTWGAFAQGGQLRYSVATGQDSLNNYRPEISLEQSGISYAGNRVASLTLQSIRWTMSDGEVYQINAPIDIDSDLDPWN